MLAMSMFIAICCVLLGPGAEEMAGESVQWAAYDADRIVVGVVTGTSRVEGTRDEITLKITETLKGAHEGEVKFGVQSMNWEQVSDRIRTKRIEAVFYLVDGKRYKDEYGPLALREHCRTIPAAITLDGEPEVGVFDLDFREHRSREAILKAVRAAVAGMEKKMPPVASIDAPWGSDVFKRLWAGSGVSFSVPADAAMEARARGWVKSADWQERINAVAVLSQLKSDQNIELLNSLLQDKTAAWKTKVDGREVIYYRVRYEAHQVLKRWEIAVPEPVLTEPVAGNP